MKKLALLTVMFAIYGGWVYADDFSSDETYNPACGGGTAQQQVQTGTSTAQSDNTGNNADLLNQQKSSSDSQQQH